MTLVLSKVGCESLVRIRYVDDTFVIIKRTKLEETNKLINNILTRIKFTREEEKNKQLPFLDVMVERRTNGELQTKVYRKAAHADQDNHQFDWDNTKILGQAKQRQAWEFLEAWNSTKKAINKHIELDPRYTPLRRKTRSE
eukprot:g27444.t1